MVLLDTSFLIDVLRGAKSIEETMDRLDREEEVYITALSIMELNYGALKSASEEEQAKLLSFLTSFDLLNFDLDSSIEASKIKYDLEGSGSMIGVEDIMIAAIAKINKQKLITRNVKHFERIEGLEIETY